MGNARNRIHGSGGKILDGHFAQVRHVCLDLSRGAARIANPQNADLHSGWSIAGLLFGRVPTETTFVLEPFIVATGLARRPNAHSGTLEALFISKPSRV